MPDAMKALSVVPLSLFVFQHFASDEVRTVSNADKTLNSAGPTFRLSRARLS